MENTTPSQSNAPHPPTRFLTVDGGSIAYDVRGSGPLLLLVPGMGDLRSGYRLLAPRLVAAGYTVVTTDLRGHGDSDATFPSYGDEETARDIEALIRELGESAVIVGNSMAAGAAVIVAANHPELVTGLVLVGPFVRDQSGNGFAMLLFRVMTAQPWAAAVWKAYIPTLYSGERPADFSEYREKVIASIKRPGYARAFSKTTRLNHAVAGESLAKVAAPTLVVMGDKDPDFTNPQAEAEWIARELRGTAVMVANAGHYPQSQQPELTSAAVIPFLASLSSNA